MPIGAISWDLLNGCIDTLLFVGYSARVACGEGNHASELHACSFYYASIYTAKTDHLIVQRFVYTLLSCLNCNMHACWSSKLLICDLWRADADRNNRTDILSSSSLFWHNYGYHKRAQFNVLAQG